MSPWFLLALALVCAYLAYDAWRLSTARNELPYSVIAKLWGQDLSDLPLSEQEKLKSFSDRHGIGGTRGAFWLFVILAGGLAAASVVALAE